MSRAIKFRTFAMGRMFYWGFGVGGDESHFSGPVSGSGVLPHKSPQMQFTGLHDVNGTEIYEGDIVGFYDDYSEEVSIHQVKFYGSKGYPAFDLDPSISDDTNGFAVVYQAGDGKLTVIGNIYQNSDLLESAK